MHHGAITLISLICETFKPGESELVLVLLLVQQRALTSILNLEETHPNVCGTVDTVPVLGFRKKATCTVVDFSIVVVPSIWGNSHGHN